MSGRPRVAQACPGCGAPIRWAVYIPPPSRMGEQRRRGRVPLDLPAVADDDAAGEYAATPSGAVCRRVRPGEPIDVSERRHTHHAATHPQCRPALYPTTPPTPPRRTR